MAWNRPSEEKKAEVEKRGGQRNVHLKGLVAGLIVVLGAAVAAWLLWPDAKRPLPTSTSASTSLIKEVTPQLGGTPQPQEEARPREKDAARVAANHETYVDENGVRRYRKGNGRVPDPDEFKNPIMITRTSCIPAFRHECESEIAMLITLEPGEPLVGEMDYRHMRQDFVAALSEEIEFSEDDTPYAREIKQAVIETKKELAERVRKGEDIVDILRDARQELQRGFAYRSEIDDLLNEQLQNPEATEEDLKTAVEAANKMLIDRGIVPVKEKSFLLRRKRIEQVRRQRTAE